MPRPKRKKIKKKSIIETGKLMPTFAIRRPTKLSIPVAGGGDDK